MSYTVVRYLVDNGVKIRSRRVGDLATAERLAAKWNGDGGRFRGTCIVPGDCRGRRSFQADGKLHFPEGTIYL
jgi:hypothetical protein